MSENSKAELLIIGGGVIGLSIAYHCAEAGVDVVLLEKGEFGTATTSQTARAFRTYFPRKPYDTELAVRSFADFRSFAGKMGFDPGLEKLGLLTVLTGEKQAEELIADLPAHREAGGELEVLTAAQACELNPWLDPDTIEAAIWSPQTYRVKPEVLVRGYAEAADKLGARALSGVTVTELDASTGRVGTTSGEFTAEAIVIAAGPWSGDVAGLAGLDLPVWGQFAELLHTDPLIAEGRVETPFTFHPVSGLKTMGLGKSFLVGLERISKQHGMRDIWFQAAVDELPKWYPQLENPTLHSAWTGTLDVTPTRSALLGRGEGEHERLLFAAGFTGHGIAQAPAAGQLVRDVYLGREPAVDLTPYSLETVRAKAAENDGQTFVLR
ncbi:NAD(P)/FAD-dependent oxidoreductase [Sciscionella sediminilitoris]|uniref:NAD(P)/FAD-dependent oxidoreductase n=1 Tax=Sciscionella sediminilitoris TaxID=1445613 RepID=UPI0006925F32|nr:FAD-binding oxidoreductase [Sciscionella sp. SE31]